MADVLKKVPVREQEPKVRATNFEEVCYGYNKEEAMEEATRCLNCKNARCIQGCPVSINIPAFIAEIKEGNIEEAYKVIGQSSALPAICGRVCPQESQCESKCVRGIKGDAVSIGKLERFVADYALENDIKPEKPEKKQEKAERKETAAKQEQTEPVREKKTDRKKLRDGNAISEGTVKVEYAVTDTEENLPGQMTFGMEESESGLEEFSDEETKAEDPVQTEEISVDEEITAETDADGFRAVEETDEVPFDEDDEISFDAEEEEETPEETAEEVLEDMAHEEDAEEWAEKVICNFGVYAGTPLGEMMQDARGYQTIKWLVQRYKGQNQEIQKAAKILLDHEKEMQKAA